MPPRTPPRGTPDKQKPTVGGNHIEKTPGGPVFHGKDNTVAHLRNGHVTEIRRSNTVVRHPLGGPRTVEIHKPGDKVVVASGTGHGYVQRPFTAGGRTYVQRTYIVNNRVYGVRVYRPLLYHGVLLNFYTPGYYYPGSFYGWAGGLWLDPVAYSWDWLGSPWYAFYGPYFRPWGVYGRASFWLTDFLMARTLQAEYQARTDDPALDDPAPLESSAMSPEVKQEIDEEVRNELAEEQAEAGAPDAPPADSQLPASLVDSGTHLFVASSKLEVETATGGACVIGAGDALRMTGGLPSDGSPAHVLVRASMGSDCPVGTTVSVPLPDLVEMHNHMRETLEEGLDTLHSDQGKDNLPTLPEQAAGQPVRTAFASSVVPDDDAAQAVAAVASQGGQIEQEVQADANIVGGSPNPPVGGPSAPAGEAALLATVQVGQSESQVIAILGRPVNSSFLGGLTKMYEYPSGKVIFTDGAVSEVEGSGGVAPRPPSPPDGPVSASSAGHSVTEGMTESQVIAILGQPLHTSFLGGLRKMYEYSDRKIVFVDGAVSEVQ